MLTFGPYRAVYEAHQAKFLSEKYSKLEAAALAQTLVSKPLPECALPFKADFLQEALPDAKYLLEFDSLKVDIDLVQNALVEQCDLFLEGDNDDLGTKLYVSALYKNLVIVEAVGPNEGLFAADVKIDGAQVTFSNIRDVQSYKNVLAAGVAEGLLPVIELLEYDLRLPLEIEREYLSALIAGVPFLVPEAKIDGWRPVVEKEFVRFLQNTNLLAEGRVEEHVMPEGTITPKQDSQPLVRDARDAIVRLAVVSSKIANLERKCFEARLAIARTLDGSRMTEKATTIQSVIIDKAKFSKSEAHAMAKRNNWSGTVDETSDSFRMRQHEPGDCQNGSFRTISLKAGVKATICTLKGASKSERESVKAKTLNEAGDYTNVAGHHVFVDADKAKEGDMSGVEAQIKKHNAMGKSLKSQGFKQSNDYDGMKHSKDTGNGYRVSVKLAGGKANTSIERHGRVIRAIGYASDVDELNGHVETAQEEAAELPEVNEASEVGS